MLRSSTFFSQHSNCDNLPLPPHINFHTPTFRTIKIRKIPNPLLPTTACFTNNFYPSLQIFLTGNAFLANVALADLLVTGLVIPASAIVILAGHKESPVICRFEWTLEALCFLVTVLTLATIAMENYARLCLPAER